MLRVAPFYGIGTFCLSLCTSLSFSDLYLSVADCHQREGLLQLRPDRGQAAVRQRAASCGGQRDRRLCAVPGQDGRQPGVRRAGVPHARRGALQDGAGQDLQPPGARSGTALLYLLSQPRNKWMLWVYA